MGLTPAPSSLAFHLSSFPLPGALKVMLAFGKLETWDLMENAYGRLNDCNSRTDRFNMTRDTAFGGVLDRLLNAD